jgi:hypothetical protein
MNGRARYSTLRCNTQLPPRPPDSSFMPRASTTSEDKPLCRRQHQQWLSVRICSCQKWQSVMSASRPNSRPNFWPFKSPGPYPEVVDRNCRTCHSGYRIFGELSRRFLAELPKEAKMNPNKLEPYSALSLGARPLASASIRCQQVRRGPAIGWNCGVAHIQLTTGAVTVR